MRIEQRSHQLIMAFTDKTWTETRYLDPSILQSDCLSASESRRRGLRQEIPAGLFVGKLIPGLLGSCRIYVRLIKSNKHVLLHIYYINTYMLNMLIYDYLKRNFALLRGKPLAILMKSGMSPTTLCKTNVAPS